MSDVAIRVEGIGKQYRIGEARPSFPTLRDAIAASARRAASVLFSPMRSFRERTRPEMFWALRDVSFEVKEGDVVGIIGGNGAGKSTLLKILSRITEPTEGRAEIYGRVGSLLEVGTGFHPELTGRENTFLNGAILGMSRQEIARKFDEIVAFAEVERFIDTPVKHYSSGMYLRLAFAVAAHLEPEILIVDEVLAVGDAAFQKKCLGKMGDVARHGRTVLFVSHNMGMIQALCHRALFVHKGRIVTDGPVADTIATYLRRLESQASGNLLARTERQGRGHVKLARVDVRSDEPSPATLATGRPVTFRFALDGLAPHLACSFTIYDHLGQPVTNFNSAMRSEEDAVCRGEADFLCRVEELPLLPGRYRINVTLTSQHGLEDYVEAAAYFDVTAGTLRGRPSFDMNGRGTLLFPHRWVVPSE